LTRPEGKLIIQKQYYQQRVMKRARQIFAIALAAIAGAGTLQQAAAHDSAFYSSKTLNLVVGYSAGGGYDQYARLLARHFGRHIPGQPTVVVQNMPGAASLTAVRHLANAAPKDGTAITMFDPGLILESLSAPEKFNVKFSDYQYLGGMSREVTICYAWHTTGIRTWDDMMRRKEFLVGLTAKGSAVYANGAVLRKLFKAPIRQVGGYPGSNEQRLASSAASLKALARHGARSRRTGSSTASSTCWRALGRSVRPTWRPRLTSMISRPRRSSATCSTSSTRQGSWAGHSSSPGKCRASAHKY